MTKPRKSKATLAATKQVTAVKPDTVESSISEIPSQNVVVTQGGVTLRIDPPHKGDDGQGDSHSDQDVDSAPIESTRPIPQAPEPSPEKIAAVAGLFSDAAASQIQMQADQLSEGLRSRQRGLDRREAQLNSRSAALEDELRNSQLWTQERNLVFEQRESELSEIAHRLEEQATALSAAEIAVESDWKQLREEKERQVNEAAALKVAEQRQQLHCRQQGDQLTLEWQRLETKKEEAVQMFYRLHDNLKQHRRSLERREARLERLETAIEDGLRQIETTVAQLEEERRRFREFAERRKADIEEKQRRMEQQWERVNRELDQRAELLRGRQTALDALRDDVNRVHGEALEMRLITEQLWAQFTPHASSPELTKSLSQLRAKLAAHQQKLVDTIRQKADDMRVLAEKLGQRQQDLQTQKKQFHQWANNRSQELDEQSCQLQKREEEIERSRWHAWEQRKEWLLEKKQLQLQLRKLTEQASENERAA